MEQHIFFDFDQTLVDTNPLIARYLYDAYGVEIKDMTRVNTHHLDREVSLLLGVELDHYEFWRRYASEFLTSWEYHQHIELISGAEQVVNTLSKDYTLHLVTTRQESSRQVVERILKERFEDHFRHSHFVWQHDSETGYVRFPKRDYIKQFENRIAFIDDYLEEIEETKDIVPSFLLDPVGIHMDHPNRISSIIKFYNQLTM